MSEVVHVVDDDPAVRTALARVLTGEGMTVVLSGSTQEFMAAYDPSTCSCVVLDLRLPGDDGLQLQTRLGERGRVPPVVFLTGCGDIPSTVRAMKAGALDFLTKPVDIDALLEAVRRGMDQDRRQRVQDVRIGHARALMGTLTAREREVLVQVVAGRLNKQIAADFGIAEKTIKVHRAHLMHKLGLHTVADLVRFAEQVAASEAGAQVAVSMGRIRDVDQKMS